jgi:DNA helicase-2/ATP-dependent DNA helicase PcrA
MTATTPAPCAPDSTIIPPRLLEGLNPEQAEAVRTLTGPLLVVAGPGSGKTRVLVHRIAALLSTGTPPWAVLAVTFTNKAAAEMRERVATLVGEETASRMWIATFHSACVRILRYHHAEAGLPRSFSIADTKDSAKLVAQALEAHGLLPEGLTPAERKKTVKDAHTKISRAKNNNRGPEDLARSIFPDERDLAAVMASYNQLLRTRGAVDFDDILTLTLHLLRTRPEIADRYISRFQHLLVDEYQDTNTVQYDITRILGRHGNVCVVGDADQSIYAFRGANPSVLTSFTNDFAGAKVVTLGQNYRSTKRIVDVAQSVIAPNPAVHRAQLRTDNQVGEKVRLIEAENNYVEAEWVVEQIRARGGNRNDHAVLVRTNFLTRALEAELSKHNIPHQVVGALRFYDRAEVQDALTYLRLAVNPADAIAFERAVSTPRRGIGTRSVTAILEEASSTGRTPLEVLAARADGTSAAARAAAGFLEAMAAVTAAAQDGPDEALNVVAGRCGLRAHLKALGEKEGSTAREENLDELISYAAKFVEDGSATDPEARDIATLPGWEQTEAFLENVSLVSAAETATGDDPEAAGAAGKVSLLTMHAAKGKEYKHVYVVGLEDNICPHNRALTEGGEQELEEERRLLFVAVSRARETLDLSYCRKRTSFNKDTFNPPSRFLDDLPADVERLLVAQAYAPAPRPPVGPRGGFAPARPAAHTRGKGLRAAPAATGPRLTEADLSEGAVVSHPMFGTGTVVTFDRSTVTVNFKAGTKMLSLAAAPLTLKG